MNKNIASYKVSYVRDSPLFEDLLFYMKLIPLTQGQFAKVDDDDFEWLMTYKWYAKKVKSGYFYAYTKRNKKIFSMHRLIMNTTDKCVFVDHKLHDTLDNRKSELRIATRSQNGVNKKQKMDGANRFVGVHKVARSKTFRVMAYKDNKQFYVGSFNDEVEAALAYNEKAKELHGEFAFLNKIP